MVCWISVFVYGLLFLSFFFLIIGILPLYAIYYRKVYLYPINFGFLILNQDNIVQCNVFSFFFSISSLELGPLIYFDLSILFVNVCISISCPLIFFLCYSVKNNSPILCKLFWPISFLWQPLLDDLFLKFTIFHFTWESVSK